MRYFNNKIPTAWAYLAETITTSHSHTPEVWVVLLSAHDDGLEHGSLSHHKLDHPVDEAQQVPGRTKDKRIWEHEWVYAPPSTLPLSHSFIRSSMDICQFCLTLKYLKRHFSSQNEYWEECLRGCKKSGLPRAERRPSDARPVHGFYAKKNTPPAGRLNNTTILILLIYSCNNQDFKKIISCNNRLSCKMYLERGNVAVSEPVGRFPSKIECKPDCPHIIKSLSNYPPIFNYL